MCPKIAEFKQIIEKPKKILNFTKSSRFSGIFQYFLNKGFQRNSNGGLK